MSRLDDLDAHARLSGAAALPDESGADGNARLTGAVGALLLVLLFVEGITILRIRQLIGVHVFVGMLLVPPVLLKTGSTVYRFYRYYTGSGPYVRKGPPHPLLRLAGPFVILLTLVLLGSGIGLLAVSPDQPGLLLAVHKGSFVLWFAAMSVHVLGHLFETATLAWREVRAGASAPAAARRRRARLLAIAVSLAVGVALGAVLLPSAAPWSVARFHSGG